MASESTGLLCLPPEILTKILCCNTLRDRDVCNVSQVCQGLHEVCRSNDIWKAKFRQRWQDTLKLGVCIPSGGWYELHQRHLTVFNQVHRLVRDIAARNYHKTEVSEEEFVPFLQLGESCEDGQKLVLGVLRMLLETDRQKQLTDKYYGKKVYHFLQHKLLHKRLRTFLAAPLEEQALEKCAFFVSSWLQTLKDVKFTEISAQLDDVADKVRLVLGSSGSSSASAVHPACSKDNSVAGFHEDLWSPSQCQEVLKAINTVLYEQMGFQGNTGDYYNPQNSFIEEVLQCRKGIPITLSIMYSAVARRLGVVCEPVNFPSHFLLRFRQHPMAAGLDQYVFIDAFHKGRARTHQQCLIDLLNISYGFEAEVFHPTTPLQVLLRMTRNLVSIARTNSCSDDHLLLMRDGVTLYLAAKPDDTDMTQLYARICMHLNINLPSVLESLQRLPGAGGSLAHECEKLMLASKIETEKQNPPKKRAAFPEVAFSVGMVMKHKRYHYTCVVYGWDVQCQASAEWISRMGVHNLQSKQYQPFYNVLVEDGSNRYAAQENLLLTQEVREISHSEVGKFFEEFQGRFYIPNDDKLKEYPDDLAETEAQINRFFEENQQE